MLRSLLAGAAASALLAGCAVADGPAGGGDQTDIVFFNLDTSICPCLNLMYDGVDEEAEKLDVDVKYITAGLDASVQLEQIQQYIDSGQTPDGFMVMALDPRVVSGAVKKLTTIAPVLQVQIEPPAEDFDFISAFVGLDPNAIGSLMGEGLLNAREAVREEGRELNTPEGNLLVIGSTPTNAEYDLREAAAFKVIDEEPFNVLQKLRIEDSSTQGTYEAVTQLLPQLTAKGMDFILSNNGDQTAGLIKALKQAGIEPGKDVTVVSGDCSTSGYGIEDQKKGEVFAQSILPHHVSGQLWIQTMLQVLHGGEVIPDSYTAPLSPDGAPELDQTAAPHQRTYVPVANAEINDLDSIKIWGLTADEICPVS